MLVTCTGIQLFLHCKKCSVLLLSHATYEWWVNFYKLILHVLYKDNFLLLLWFFYLKTTARPTPFLNTCVVSLDRCVIIVARGCEVEVVICMRCQCVCAHNGTHVISVTEWDSHVISKIISYECVLQEPSVIHRLVPSVIIFIWRM